MSVDLKTLTPDTTINDSAVLFGADSQASSSPSVYAVSTVRQHIVGTANTFTQPQIVSVSSSSNALRITQTGSGNALLVEDEASTDSSPFVIDANGNIVQGETTVPTGFAWPVVAQTGVFSGGPWNVLTNKTNDATGPTTAFRKDRAGAVVASGDIIGTLRWFGYDGSTYINTAFITSAVDGTPGTNDMPGRLAFFTTADGSATAVERMRITSAGRVGIGTSSPVAILQSTVSDGTFGFFVTGATRGVRFVPSSTAMSIEGIDNTGSASFQPLIIGGSDLRFATNNAERMRISSDGSVSIATPVSGVALAVNSLASTSQALRIVGRASDNLGTLEFTSNSQGTQYGYIQSAPTYLAFSSSFPEDMRIDSSGNLLLGTTVSPTTGTQTLTIETGTAPTATPADTISIYSTDLSAGNTMLSIYTEGTSVNANTTAAATHRIAVRINGTVYYLLANTAA